MSLDLRIPLSLVPISGKRHDRSTMTFTAVVPINYLLRRTLFHGSFPLASSHPDLSETEVVKALRTHASHTLEVRMRLAPLPLLLPWHPLRPSDMGREKLPGRET